MILGIMPKWAIEITSTRFSSVFASKIISDVLPQRRNTLRPLKIHYFEYLTQVNILQ